MHRRGVNSHFQPIRRTFAANANKTNKGRNVRKYVAVVAALLSGIFLVPQAYAQDADMMVTPSELQWNDAVGCPPGTKVAVLEGPMNEAGPFTVESSSSRVPGSRLTGIQRLNTSP
jgi:hypothetical protein